MSEADEVSVSLVASSVCLSTAILLLASAEAARRIINDDAQRVTSPKNDFTEASGPFSGDHVVDISTTNSLLGLRYTTSAVFVVWRSYQRPIDD
ncbi:uncharacterized protein EDB91DRAFT_830313 [Suillus paluster]|uniref:uncharacterized protein n=1 Tax=Suillus paluster TaxID=48578 RepID=UPI001B882BC5|nr:uncharacterized protein EDB91DRAFT_830313 [Suillus paluster]KAG1749028.1 hypothetical protein EDB91DRAFT_830313 [Suillus paluster]